MASNKVCIALIHNNNCERNAAIRPRLAELTDAVSREFEAEYFEISSQPEITPQRTVITLLNDLNAWKLNREWTAYRDIPQQNLLFDLAGLFKQLVASFCSGSARAHRNRIYAIELILTDKHIRVWNEFLQKDGDILFAFEDDALFKEDSIPRILEILAMYHQYRNRPCYFDLAGGIPFDELLIDRLEIGRDGRFRQYRKPVTNTICAYAINRTTATAFVEILVKQPWLRLVSTDFLVNKLLTHTAPRMDYVCHHADPHIFEHGSATKRYASSLDSF